MKFAFNHTCSTRALVMMMCRKYKLRGTVLCHFWVAEKKGTVAVISGCFLGAPWTDFGRKCKAVEAFLRCRRRSRRRVQDGCWSPAACHGSTCLWEALLRSQCGLGAQQFTLRLKNSSASTLPFTFPNTDLKADISSTNTGHSATAGFPHERSDG